MTGRVLLHCQHSLGLGHLVRSLALAGGLAEHLEVTVLNGGRFPNGMRPPSGVELVDLPSLGHDAGHRLVSHEPGRTVDDIKADRRRIVLDTFKHLRPDVVVVELYPFGRRKFEFELIPLLDAALAHTPRPLVLSSVRDLLVTREDQRRCDEQAAVLANTYLDAVLVHSDPAFARFEESFDPATPLAIPVHHTGFVVPPRPTRRPRADHQRIVVSAGGGMVGEELLATAVRAAPALVAATGLTTTIVGGPLLPPEAGARLRASAGGPVTFLDHVDDLCGLIADSAASVSQAGYNTTLDVLRAGRPAVVVPYEAPGEDEQTRRASRLARLGLVQAIQPSTLTPARLLGAVVDALATPPPSVRLDLEGRTRAGVLITTLLAARMAVA